jgi:DNA replication protein DnaC
LSPPPLITTLGKALAEGKFDERLKLLTQPQLLICDEIGYPPIDHQGANLFFQLVSRRYERVSIIITSNQSLGAWGEVFGDTVIASAVLDRLVHHSIAINIKGESFRLKEKLKAGPLKPRLDLVAPCLHGFSNL